MNALLRLTLGVALVAGAAGCSVKKCNISGTITQAGEPLVAKTESGFLLVLFIPLDRKADPLVYRAETDRDKGTYTLDGIPAGKYRVAIQQFDERHNDALGHSLNPPQTPLRYEVSEDGQVLDIDLPKDLPRAAPPRPKVPFPKKGPPKDDD
jgi:hypothetical protein